MKKKRVSFLRIVKYFFSGFLATAVLFFLTLLLLPKPTYKDGFKNLSELVAYAKQTNEEIQPDSDNTIKPDFSSYYKTFTRTWKTKLKEKCSWLLTLLRLKKPPLWSPSFFKSQLDSLAATREIKGYKEDFICKITGSLESKFVLFGTLQGAYHSFVRDLVRLKEISIIDENLKITNADTYIILIGDVVSRSPFTMETLSAVMKLMQVNPHNVIYLRGNHESNNYWQEHTLKTELQIRAAYLSAGTIPLADEVNKFFNTLPLALYITMVSDQSNEFIRISDAGREQNPMLIEPMYASFLTSKSDGKYACFNLKDRNQDASSSDDTINIRVIFKGEKKRETFQPSEGLRLLPSDQGSIAWNPISCPTVIYRKALKFVHDAFVVITPGKRTDEWKITLHNRDIRTKEPFKATTLFLLSGTELHSQKTPAGIKPLEAEKKAPDAPKKDTVQAPAAPAPTALPAPIQAAPTTPAPAVSTPPGAQQAPVQQAPVVPTPTVPAPAPALIAPAGQPTPTTTLTTPTPVAPVQTAPQIIEPTKAPIATAQKQPALDTVTTTTLQERVASINSHLEVITQEVRAIAAQLDKKPAEKTILPAPPEQAKLSTPVPAAPAQLSPPKQEKSAFEPITPE